MTFVQLDWDGTKNGAQPQIMVQELSVGDFARRYAQRATQLAWLLGAGASASAGIPTAGHMIAEFKAALFAQAHKIARRELDADDPVWVRRINAYFDNAHGFPALGDPREYEVAFETTYPEPRDRRAYIDQLVERGTPSFGHRVLAALITSGQAPLILTPNFDPLVERAANSASELVPPEERHTLAPSAINNSDVAVRCLAEGDWPLLVKLHGDYRSTALKNTEDELRAQDEQLRQVTTEALRRFGLVVVGYSGRDASVMEALEEVVTGHSPYPGGLFWIARPENPVMPNAIRLLDQAVAAGVDAHLVPCDTFDELLGEIERQTSLPDALASAVSAARPAARVVDVAVPTVRVGSFPTLRFNALPLESWPTLARGATLADEPRDLRALVRGARARVDVVNVGRQLIWFGADDDLRAVLQVQSWQPTDVAIDITSDTVAHGLVFQALTRALARSRPLRPVFRSRGHMLVIRSPRPDDTEERKARLLEQRELLGAVYGGDLFGVIPNAELEYAEGVVLRLDHRADRWWVVFEPSTWVARPAPDGDVDDVVANWLRKRWVTRRNAEWAAMVDAWARTLAPESPTEVRAWWLQDGGVDAVFAIGDKTAWSPPGQRGLT